MIQEPIILIGGGGHCKSVIDVIEQQAIYKIAGIIDVPEKLGEKVLGYEIIGNDSDLPNLAKKYANFHITLGQIRNSEARINMFHLIKNLGVSLPIIISPHAYVSPYSIIGEGTCILHFALLNTGSVIGKNCIINSKALIEHDVEVADYCHISTGAILNGGVKIGEASFVGSGAVTRENISIPPNSFIKANSIVK